MNRLTRHKLAYRGLVEFNGDQWLKPGTKLKSGNKRDQKSRLFSYLYTLSNIIKKGRDMNEFLNNFHKRMESYLIHI